MGKIFLCLIFLLLSVSFANAQVSLSLTITDNLITNAFTFDPPKPAAAKSNFKIINDNGIQVFFYFNAEGTSTVGSDGYRVRLIAYRDDPNNMGWVNELTYLLKKDDKYGVVAMNFFKPGPYMIVVSESSDKSKVLASGTFTVEKN